MASSYRVNSFVLVCMLLLLHLKDCSGISWSGSPTSASGIQGQSVSITWISTLSGDSVWDSVKVYQRRSGSTTKYVVIKYDKNPALRVVYPAFTSRDADMNLTASENGTVVKAVFTLRDLDRASDEHSYLVRIHYTSGAFGSDSEDSPDVSLTVLVPPSITSPNPKTVTVNESQAAQLECTVAGNPTPRVNWTRNGVFVGTEVFTTPIVSINDHETCYTCIAYNGVLDAKSANVCLNVQYKPRNATVLSDKTIVCQNDKVNLTCTSGPAKPAPSSYEFYNNGVLVETSASNVYETTATAGLPDVNKFVCVPRNLLGGSLENGSVEVTAKVTPTVTQTFGNTKTAVEGSNLTLACTASGTPPLNVTWARTGRPGVVGFEYPIIDIKRGDAGLYSCTVNSGAECPSNTAIINVTVNYKPYLTNLTSTLSNACVNDTVTLECTTDANQPVHEYRFYLNDELVYTSSSGVYQFNIPQAGNNIYKCEPVNIVGTGQNATVTIPTKAPPQITYVSPSNTFIEGANVVLLCNVMGSDPLNVTWSKDGVSSYPEGSSHTFASIGRGDEATYQCTVHNGNECPAATATLSVTVIYPPSNTTIDITGNRITVKEGESLILNCRSDSRPDASYTWKYNDVLLSSPQNRTLIVKRINRRQGGLYRCEAKNRLGFASSNTIKIVVQYLDSLIANGNTNKSYSQSNPVIWFNLSFNAYPSNVSLSCKSSAPNILTIISNQNTRFSVKQYLVIVIIKSAVDSGSIVCKAEHITGGREITLDFYRQMTVFREEFSGQFEITNQEWQDDLGKSESNRFKTLKGKCIKIFKAAYDGITFLASIKIKEFLKGSVIVQFQLEVIKQVPDPLMPLKTYIEQKGGEIEGLRIDYNSIQKSKGHKPQTQSENETIIVAVLGTLFALSIVLNIILIVYLIWVRTKDSRRDSEKRRYNNDEMGQTDEIALQETNFNNPGMSTPNSELEYEPIGRRGLATSNPSISEYEAVATRTRPTQSPSDADNSVPQYERVHHQGQPGAPSKQPSAIYKNIPGGQSGNYGSLSPSTRLPYQGASQTGEYQALQRKVVSPQYQSLDDLVKC